MSEDCELLFFDTFSHDTCELNLDLVQFPNPVYIFEIRVIPLGARVQADFPGGHRLGATNPSSFQLEFFVNDLTKKDASIFDRLGSMEYKQNADIQFPATTKIPTDGLVLRGWYSAVTLAVYGVLAKTTDKEHSSPPPPPPPQSTTRSSQDHGVLKGYESPATAETIPDWDRSSRISEVSTDPPVRVHTAVEAPRFADVPTMMHSQSEQHAAYPTDIPNVIGNFTEPPPAMVYQDCVGVPQVAPNPTAYAQYDAHYPKPWAPPEEQYAQPAEPYDHQMYNRPPDPNIYQPQPPEASRPMWDTKDHHASADVPGHEHDNYNRTALLEIPSLLREKDMSKDRTRDRLWERDLHDYKDDDRNRDHESKRKDRGRRSRETSWEQGSNDLDRYRDRDRIRDRDRERDRNRERSYMDRGVRKDIREAKRPTTPPSPRKIRPHTPQTPPEGERMISGPRTPKEDEPTDNYEEQMDIGTNYFEPLHRDHSSAERMYNLSEGEIQDGDNTEDDDGYEEIVSEEEDMSDIEDRTVDMSEIDYDLSDDSWNFMPSYMPFSCELTSFQHFSDPCLFPFEVLEGKITKEKNKSVLDGSADKADNVLESLNYPEDQDHDERWVELLEGINEDTLTSLLNCNDKLEGIFEKLLDWTVEGLNFEAALKQPQTAYKVRHLKAGICLATLLFRSNEKIITELLNRDVPKLLLQLFYQPYMVLPVKLLLLRGLDAAISTKSGMKYVSEKKMHLTSLKQFEDFKSSINTSTADDCGGKERTCYQILLDILASKQLTRAVVTLSSVLNKIHLHEMLFEFTECVEKVIQGTQFQESKSAPSESPEVTEAIEPRATSVEAELEAVDALSDSGESHVQIIVSCLQEVTASYKNAWKNLGLAKRYIPARSQFEFPKSPINPYPSLLRMFKENNLLENIFVVLSSPALCGHTAVLLACKELLLEILSSHEGMLYFLSIPDVTNGILRALLHTVDDPREEGADENISQNLGSHIVCHLQALLYVDSLLAYHAKDGSKKVQTESDAISALHDMYSMVFLSVGRLAVIKVLTTADNLHALLPFVQMSGDQLIDSKRSKSVCAGYVTEMLMLVVHYSEDIPFLEKFSDVLHDLSQQELTPKLHDLMFWTSPARSIPNYTHEAIAPLIAILKAHTEDAASLPPELITSLRILQHLTLPPATNDEKTQELKYMYAIIHVFSNNGMEIFKSILQNICDVFLKPSHQSPSLMGLQGVLVIAIIKPAISIMKAILAYLIKSRGAEFKDLTHVPVLLNIFSLVLLVPPGSHSYNSAQAVQTDIVEALLTYTQPYIGSTESEEALSKSLWTEMMQEILKHIILSPSNFVTGLTVLSELLPLPLPLQTREPLSDDEVLKMVNYRKLWSAHLHSLSGMIQEVIVSLAATSCHPLQQLLRRVCVQLVDLAAPTAVLIVRAVLDALLEALVVPVVDQKENFDPGTVPPTPTLKPPTSTTARALTLLAYLVSHASFKVPLLHVMKGSVKADEKYMDVLPLMLELFSTPSDKTCVIQAQECIVSILQSFCDPDISFVTFESGAQLEEVLSSSLPCKEQMSLICSALVQHIGTHKHSYSSVLPSLRSLVMLTEHDYGYFHVKQGLDQNPRAVYSLFMRFSETFCKDSSDCLSTLSTTLEFLRLMMNGFEDGAQTGRTILLSTRDLADFLRGDSFELSSKENDDTKSASEPFQPVVELEKQLTELGNDEEAVESLQESISSLLSLLNSAAAKEDKVEKEIAEPILPPPESQSSQFATRAVYMVGDIEEGRLSPAYWLALPGAEDADQEQEQVPVDLQSIAEKSIPGGFDLKLSLESIILSNEGDDSKSKKKGISIIGNKRKYSPLINPALVDVNNKRPFIAPMRGRGFTRAASHSSRANDPFRSRPPNTSRPPSMHVDDFLAMESHHSGSSSQSQIKRPIKDTSRGRGSRGGFERNQVFPSTGRFFSPPTPYGRRDSNRGNGRGTNRISSISWNSRSSQSSGLKLSPGQRNNFGSHRSDYISPFNQTDSRPVGQRSRDSYQSNNIPLGRFSRGSRTGSSMNQPSQGHWQDNRNKSQNQRFLTPGLPSRGRRDMNSRSHTRAFTR